MEREIAPHVAAMDRQNKYPFEEIQYHTLTFDSVGKIDAVELQKRDETVGGYDAHWSH